MAVFWVVAPCRLVEVYRRFRGACCLIIRAITWCNNPEDSHVQDYVSFYVLEYKLLICRLCTELPKNKSDDIIAAYF
jgi:hypothetical protein